MEERYEIRGKIGQGGLGAVYKGYDTRMNREVAIKRISVSNDDPSLLEESTRQLIKEAGALASLQHPHIVTVYDVGSDEDGPYVVMELISGKTLDELIEVAPLTWPDFRELALQTQEALIAAQELDLIHGDIKPSNLMLTWLPSGKFQIKIVDFGLATLTQSQSKEELEEMESVFGSIFFMAPEQFERVPLDARADLYAMACVYYQSLTGTYPFRGETGNEVMASHLHHQVIPIQEIRSGIPNWACDWIMWNLNRQRDDRPASARESLQVFLQNDKNSNPTLSLGVPPPPPIAPPRTKLLIPGAAASPAHGTRRIIDPRLAPPGYVPPSEQEPVPVPPLTATAPQPLLPPEGSKPSIHTGPLLIPEPEPQPTAQVTPSALVLPAATIRMIQERKQKSNSMKIAIAAVMSVVLILLGFLLYQRVQDSKDSNRINVILEMATQPANTEIPMNGPEFGKIIEIANDADTDAKRVNAMRALAAAKATDSSDFDATLTEFVTKTGQMLPEVRTEFIRNVLAQRNGPTMIDPLIEFARSTNDINSAVAAMEAIRPIVGNGQFETLLGVVQFHPNAELRKAAAATAATIFKKSGNRGELINAIDKALADGPDATTLKLLGQINGEGDGVRSKDSSSTPSDRATNTDQKFRSDGLTPVATGEFTHNGLQTVTFKTPVKGRYFALESLDALDGQPFAAIAELIFMDANGNDLPRQQMHVIYADSEESKAEDGSASNVLDNRPNTFWHTEWKDNRPAHPHQVVIDLGGDKTLTGFRYLPRAGQDSGHINHYRAFLSETPFPGL